MHPLAVELFFILAWMTGASIAQQSCSLQNPCPAATPCCSQYGFCGTGSYCGIGCNPYGSATYNSCNKKPACKSNFYDFSDPAVTSRIVNNTVYDGNVTAHDFVLMTGQIEEDPGNGLNLLLSKENGGTLMSSTRYMLYGNVSFTLMERGQNGTVLAAILMADLRQNMTKNRAEIDTEFPGASNDTTQINYFAPGPSTVNNGITLKGFTNEQILTTYTFAWTPDTIEVFINETGPILTLNRTDHMINGVPTFPSDPATVQVSLWPAGIPGVPNGTVQWAGGMINWSDTYYVKNKYFKALVKSINVSCYDATTEFQSYVYNKSPTNDTAVMSLVTDWQAPSSLPIKVGRQLRRALAVVSPTFDPIPSISNQSKVLNGARTELGLGSAGQLRRALVVVVGLVLISCIL